MLKLKTVITVFFPFVFLQILLNSVYSFFIKICSGKSIKNNFNSDIINMQHIFTIKAVIPRFIQNYLIREEITGVCRLLLCIDVHPRFAYPHTHGSNFVLCHYHDHLFVFFLKLGKFKICWDCEMMP
jgi:hypothetical protein